MNNKRQQIPVKVSARILRHMSRGIYRTPAGALKELVSNAYDAGATEVTINTHYPVFEKIVVTDNGAGMNRAGFIAVIQNIGLSDKVAGTTFKITGTSIERVTIGHYGVGILAIGQLCKRVKITSKIKNSLEGFEAELDFEQFEVKTINGIERSIVKDEQEIEKKDKKLRDLELEEEKKKFAIGKCYLEPLKYSTKHKAAHFTKLELEGIRDIVQSKLSGNFLQDYRDIKRESKYSANFEELLKLYRENEQEISRGQYPYEKLCWELATYSPITYPDLAIFREGLYYFKNLTDIHNFKVVIDGMKMFKPFESIFFEDPKYPVKKVFLWRDEAYTKGRKVSGYIIFRQHIRPKCMQGILVRESGVAIGMHDATFLEYPYHEATKFEQLTGELFVEGLSGALSIDRNSFNQIDENYLALTRWFHKKLRKEVFAEIKKDMGVRRRENSLKIFTQTLNQYLQKYGKYNTMEFRKLGKGKNLFHKEGNILYINKDHPEGKPNKPTVDKLLLASVLVISDIMPAGKMEKMLNNIRKAKKDIEKHG